MMATILRAAALAAITSAVGYGVAAYRKAHSIRLGREDKAALHEWETDGGGNLRPAKTGSAATGSPTPGRAR